MRIDYKKSFITWQSYFYYLQTFMGVGDYLLRTLAKIKGATPA
tara:strand:+ start:533 stop:661 length:129 start_codon:yes stop_codon:yes gene_type:complete